MAHHITHVRKDDNGNILAVRTYQGLGFTTAEVVSMLKSGGHSFFSWDGLNQVEVGVYNEKWIRSHANGRWTDNLDNLPRF